MSVVFGEGIDEIFLSLPARTQTEAFKLCDLVRVFPKRIQILCCRSLPVLLHGKFRASTDCGDHPWEDAFSLIHSLPSTDSTDKRG